MNRTDLQNLAELRIKEAEILLQAASYPGSYYLAGYAIECGLKACIAKQTKEYDFPDKELVNRSYTHKLEELLKAAQLKDKLDDYRKIEQAVRSRMGREKAVRTRYHRERGKRPLSSN